MNTNWTKIRNEYINGYISQRKLAEKHGIPYQTLRDRALKEKWNDKRKAQREIIGKKTEQKTAEKIAERESDLAARINSAAEELLEKIQEATKQLDMCLVKEKRKYTRKVLDPNTGKEIFVDVEEERTTQDKSNAGAKRINKSDLRQLTSALKEIQSIQLAGKGELEQGAPNINIVVRAATLADVESDEDGEEE